MSVTCKHRQFKLVFPATLEDADSACLALRRFLAETDMENLLFEVELLVREAFSNAVVHGSGQDRQKKIDFSMYVEGKELVIEVQDEGPGFDWKNRMEREASLLDESGRGMMIFNNYSTEMKYNEKGNKITLWKSIV